MERTQSQEKSILKYLQMGFTLTPLEALKKFDCLRLSGRVHSLRQQGHNIETTMVREINKTYARYKMAKS